MNFTENRKIACVVLAVCVLVSVFLMGGGALGRERSKVLKVFDQGTDPSLSVRYSMDAYLDSASDCAAIMANEAEILVGQSLIVSDVNDQALDLANDSLGLDTRYETYAVLKSNVDKLYNAAYSGADDPDFRNFKLAYDDFWGYVDLLERDEYHKLAKGYNDLISGFPGGVVARLMGKGELNTFGG